jgi:two-component system phosphate regulon response regulator PhoB
MAIVVAVDDDRDILDLVTVVLEMADYDVVAVPQAHDVLPRIKDRQPSVFLIDIMLHQTSGIELAQSLKGSGYASTPMIGMSASPFMVQMAAKSGAFVDTIEKPFEIDLLLDVVDRHAIRNGHAPQAS